MTQTVTMAWQSETADDEWWWLDNDAPPELPVIMQEPRTWTFMDRETGRQHSITTPRAATDRALLRSVASITGCLLGDLCVDTAAGLVTYTAGRPHSSLLDSSAEAVSEVLRPMVYSLRSSDGVTLSFRSHKRLNAAQLAARLRVPPGTEVKFGPLAEVDGVVGAQWSAVPLPPLYERQARFDRLLSEIEASMRASPAYRKDLEVVHVSYTDNVRDAVGSVWGRCITDSCISVVRPSAEEPQPGEAPLRRLPVVRWPNLENGSGCLANVPFEALDFAEDFLQLDLGGGRKVSDMMTAQEKVLMAKQLCLMPVTEPGGTLFCVEQKSYGANTLVGLVAAGEMSVQDMRTSSMTRVLMRKGALAAFLRAEVDELEGEEGDAVANMVFVVQIPTRKVTFDPLVARLEASLSGARRPRDVMDVLRSLMLACIIDPQSFECLEEAVELPDFAGDMDAWFRAVSENLNEYQDLEPQPGRSALGAFCRHVAEVNRVWSQTATRGAGVATVSRAELRPDPTFDPTVRERIERDASLPVRVDVHLYFAVTEHLDEEEHRRFAAFVKQNCGEAVEYRVRHAAGQLRVRCRNGPARALAIAASVGRRLKKRGRLEIRGRQLGMQELVRIGEQNLVFATDE